MANFKKGSKAAKDFMAKIRAKKGVGKVDSKRQTGTTDKARDKKIQAKKPGKRIAKSSNKVYYERRANRSDKGRLLGTVKSMVKTYVVYFESKNDVLFYEVNAISLKSAKEIAQYHKRNDSKLKGYTTKVKLKHK